MVQLPNGETASVTHIELLFCHLFLLFTMSCVFLPLLSIFSLLVLLLDFNQIALYFCLPFALYRTLPLGERLEWDMQLMDYTCYSVALLIKIGRAHV